MRNNTWWKYRGMARSAPVPASPAVVTPSLPPPPPAPALPASSSLPNPALTALARGALDTADGEVLPDEMAASLLPTLGGPVRPPPLSTWWLDDDDRCMLNGKQ